MNPEFHIQYKTQTTIPRDNLLGRVCGWIARHPALAGLLCGLGAVGIAFARASKGAMTAPAIAAILGVIVVVVWIVLFMAMRRFFEQQTTIIVDVVRTLTVDDRTLTWTERGKTLKSFNFHTLHLRHDPQDKGKNKKQAPQAYPALLLFIGEDDRFTLETRLLDEEAMLYPKATETEAASVDEHLPTHIISPLLTLARDAS